jgi:ribosomal protein L4
VDELALDGKTKSANTVLKALTPHFPEYVNRKDKQSRILVVLGGAEKDEQARRSLANMSHVGTIRAVDLNVTGVLSYPYLLMTKDALEAVQARMSK